MAVHPQSGITSVLLAPDRAAATATRAATADTVGYSYAVVHVNVSSGVNTNSAAMTLSLQESDDTTTTTTTVTANITKATTATNAHSYFVDLRGKKRYLRLVSTPATTTNDLVTVGATLSLLRAGTWPNTTTELNASGATIV